MDTDSWVQTRGFRAGRFTFQIDTNDLQLRDLLGYLFADLEECPLPSSTFRVHVVDGRARVTGPGDERFTVRRDSEHLVNEMISSVTKQALGAEQDRLHLHASCVTNGVATALISAPSGTGKTTLAAKLALRGWTYLTDEMVGLAGGGNAVTAFPKPVSIKPGAQPFFESLRSKALVLGDVEPTIWQVPVGAAQIATTTEVEPTHIVILERSDAADSVHVADLGAADTVVALVEQSLDFDRFGDLRALQSLARLCSSATCILVQAGSPDSTADSLEQIMSAPPVHTAAGREIQVRELDPDRNCVVLWFGDQLVLRNRRTGRVLSLNEEASKLWSGIDELRSSKLGLRGQARLVVQQLEDEGFLDHITGRRAT